MSKKLFAVWLFAICIVFASSGCIFNGGDGNRPPNAPIVSCPTEAEINEEVAITVKSFDPDGDKIAYKVRYGDGTDSEWSDYFESGQEVVFIYAYKQTGDYGIKTIASDREARGEWSEDKWIKVKTSEPPPQRVMSILWMGDEQWVELMEGVSSPIVKSFYKNVAETWEVGYGGTHIVGFHEPCRPDWYPPSKVKLISYLKNYTLEELQAYAERWKDHPNNGGYWLISGHEPDITGNEPSIEEHKEKRRAEYKAIRAGDPDAWNHPVFTFYNMTSTFAHYPGWQLAFVGDDHDIFVIDCYPGKADGTIDYPGMEDGAKLVEIGKSRSKGQFIPNLDACYLSGEKPAPVVDQWEWWKERMGELKGVCFWNSGRGTWAVGVYEDKYLAEQVREVNRRLGLSQRR